MLLAALAAASTVSARPSTSSRGEDTATLADLRSLEATVRQVVDRVSPAVVRITARGRGTATASGVIVDPGGLILTAGHVVGGQQNRFLVELPDGRPFIASVVGSVFEDDLDLALLRLQADPAADAPPQLPHLALAPAGSLTRGQWILALGHAAAISSIRVGEPASRIGRVLTCDRASLAIDSPIDAGDSGGPIVDLEGRVVGIASRCGAAAWQNLATSIDAIEAWWPYLNDDTIEPPRIDDWSGRVGRRTPLGSKRDPQLLARLREVATHTKGRIVEIREADRLVSQGTLVGPGRVITKASLLARQTRSPQVVQRLGTERRRSTAVPIGLDPDLDLVLLEAPGIAPPDGDDPVRRESDTDDGTIIVIPGDAGDAVAIGIVARDCDELSLADTPDDRPFLGVATTRSRAGGLRVTTVVSNAPAARAGLIEGDRIIAIDDIPMNAAADLSRAVAVRDFGDHLTVTVARDGETRKLELTLGLRPDRSRELVPGNTSTGTSRLSSGFGPVHLVDADRPLHAVGAPAIDLDGHLVGWIVARRSRTSLVVVPWSRVLNAVAAIEPNATATEARLCSYRIVATESTDNSIRLDAEDAFPDGTSIRRERLGRDGRTTWGHWSRDEDALEWSLQIDKPGRFLVRIRAACPTRHAGTPIRFSIGDATTDGRIEGTNEWNDFQWRDLGVIKVGETGILTARLQPVARPRSAVCNLERIQLVRLRDTASD